MKYILVAYCPDCPHCSGQGDLWHCNLTGETVDGDGTDDCCPLDEAPEWFYLPTGTEIQPGDEAWDHGWHALDVIAGTRTSGGTPVRRRTGGER